MRFEEGHIGPSYGSENDRHGLPSWLISILVHLVVLLLLGVLVRSPAHGIADEPDRAVGIVVAAASDAGDEQYFDEAVKAAAPSGASDAEALPLPDQSEMPTRTDPDAALPGPLSVLPGAHDLLPRPDLAGAGRGRVPDSPGTEEILAAETEWKGRPGPKGPTANVSLFGGAPAVGRTFVFVIDRSNSMGGDGLGALALADREFNRALAELTPAHKFQIVAYHHQRVFFGDRELVPATDANKRLVSQFMRRPGSFRRNRSHDGAASGAVLRPRCHFPIDRRWRSTFDQSPSHANTKTGSRNDIHSLHSVWIRFTSGR